MKLKNFYIEKYPSDKRGIKINPESTFIGLLNALDAGRDVHECIGIKDSIIRKRLFTELSEHLKRDYDFVYNLWLSEGRGVDWDKGCYSCNDELNFSILNK
jgi:hypothetical protein|tara:strand:- start:569 stop:871 length:303 start_codon:yes stop_codon:yes gene_type:complete